MRQPIPRFLLCAWLLTSCGDTPEPPTTPDAPRWELPATPAVAVGGGEADGQDLFMVRGAVPLADGGVAVLNASTHELRRFDAAGELVDRLGRAGEGPGEFTAPAALGITGDTLLVHDPMARRVTGYTVAGDHVGDRAVDGRWAMSRVLEGGDVVAIEVLNDAEIDPATSIRRRSHAALRLGAASTTPDTLGVGPGAEYLIVRTATTERALLLPFSAQLHVAGAAGVSYTVDGTDGTVAVHGTDGQQVGAFVAGWPGRAITPALREAMITWRASVAYGGDSVGVDADLRAAPFPTTLPALDEVLADRAGNLWIGDVWTPGMPEREWQVWSRTGELLATIALPATLRPSAIADDVLVGIRVDDDGVEYVERWELKRTANGEQRTAH